MNEFDNLKLIWNEVMESFEDIMPRSSVEMLFGGLTVERYINGILYFTTNKATICKVLNDNYIGKTEERISELFGKPVTVRISCSEIPKEPANFEHYRRFYGSDAKRSTPQTTTHIGSTMQEFNAQYTFDNFIVGSSNKFAHAAAYAVATMSTSATKYNPLFIYGPSGLGKTHLMYAVTNELSRTRTSLSVIYIKGEDFTNQMIDCLSRQAMPEFRDKYRKCDVLIVDDIQFIAGKVATQEEFFHTFNALYEDSKQIIVTSDRPPKEIKTLEDRLKSRFEWGIIADIEPPDLELRLAIIKKKAELSGISLPDDVINFLAENLRSNIRQIEGSIKKLGAMSFLYGTDIDLELAKKCSSDLLCGAEPTTVTVDKIFSSVFKKYGFTKTDLIGTKRTKDIAAVRHITIYLIRQITGMSFPNIGKIFGKNHSTVMSSIETVEKRLCKEPTLEYDLKEIENDVVK